MIFEQGLGQWVVIDGVQCLFCIPAGGWININVSQTIASVWFVLRDKIQLFSKIVGDIYTKAKKLRRFLLGYVIQTEY
jgi:hypothetical protein